MKTGVIYCIENKVNGKKYIGESTNYKRRWNDHKNLLNKNKHFNNHLQNSWNKYSENNFNFKVIEKNIPLEKLDEKEIYYISKFNTFKGKGYNLTPGADKRSGKDHPMYGKRGKENPFYGRKHTKETLKKLSELKTGSNHPRSKISKKIGIKIYNEYHNHNQITQQKLAKKYNTNRNTISRITLCKHWTTRHLKEVKNNV
jgi:group I intron endonuclease